VDRRLNKEGAADGVPGTAPVGAFGERGASPFGCEDMAGGVFEWVEDPFSSGTDDGRERRTLRGGAWNCVLYLWRSYWRDGARPDSRNAAYGLRLCRDAE
jgi:sulfatase modifying factor 1